MVLADEAGAIDHQLDVETMVLQEQHRLAVMLGGTRKGVRRPEPDLARLGIERAENIFEPEDHAATLCEIMAGLAAARFEAPADEQRAFFNKHLAPWMGRLFADMENAASAKFYRPVGSLGRAFLEIEAEAFTLTN